MKNPRITAKERGLIKGALRRAFSRSELRRQCIEKSIIPGLTDPTRPRVKTWCKCVVCLLPTPKSYMSADHIEPLIPLTSSFEEMSADEVIDRLWCPIENLQAICPDCHDSKTKIENKLRRDYKRAKVIEKEGTNEQPPKRTKKTSKKRNTGTFTRTSKK